MFENIIEQSSVLQLRDDILHRRSAPSMLFYGPADCAKGSAALELARVLSCEADAAWKCACPSCARHRYLRHDDLLILGNKKFSAEIAAGQKAFLRDPSNSGAKLVFFRSIRKLMLRFSAVLMEDDPKLGKSAPVLQSLDEKLDDFWADRGAYDEAALKKLCNSLIKDALSLENEGLPAAIPAAQIRSASWWCRLAPNGKRKTLIIENAEKMRNEAGNSLLKLLEEPPDSVSIVLTSQRREALMETILSRLRPYRFLKRSVQSERDIIRRVFQDPAGDNFPETNGSVLSAYFDSFLPQSSETLYPLAAWFISSMARNIRQSFLQAASNSVKKERAPAIINALIERYDEALAAKLPAEKENILSSAQIIKTIITKSGSFENDSFSRFMKICLELICSASRSGSGSDPQYAAFNDIFGKYINEAASCVDVLNISASSALEALFHKIKTAALQAASSKALYG